MDITLYNLNETDFALTESRLNALGFLNIIQKGLNNKTIKPFIEIKNIPMIHDYNDIINKFKKANITPLSKSIEKNFNNNNTYNISFIFNLNNNLLIIGNGFDLEHDLKTHYTDFFDTINNNVSSKNEIILNNNKYLIEDNHLLLYLLEEYKQNKLQGNNWIDIETELKKIITLIEEIRTNNFIDNITYYKGENEYTIINKIQSKSSHYFKNSLSPFISGTFGVNFYKYIKEKYDTSIKTLEKDLNELTDMLRDYLLEQDISNLTKTKDISDIDYKITHVLSFNYTDTFRQLYSDIDDDKIDFIHGSLNKNNLVLGINETLTKDTENKIVDTVYFKKYFQRIYKKTDYQYVSWLDSTDSQNYADFDTVYIHGHSLDESDKEILEKIINSVLKKDTSTVKIFYYDEKHYRQEVTNLIKVLGKDVFQKYYFQNRIIFIKQTPKR